MITLLIIALLIGILLTLQGVDLGLMAESAAWIFLTMAMFLIVTAWIIRGRK